MVKQEYAAYLRSTGAQLDLAQFHEIFSRVAQGERLTIPRAVERWFDEPQNEAEQKIHDLIARRRAAQATAWQQELFAQKKRLADAERKLAVRQTKAAAESRRIAGSKIGALVAKLNRLEDPAAHAADARIFPMNYAPIVINDGGRNVVRLARYHCRMAGKPASVDSQYPGLYNARRDNIDRYWRGVFGAHHALMLVDSFYENVDRNGSNAVLHFVPQPAGTMLIACVYSVWTDPLTGRQLLSFAAVTDAPPEEVAAAGHDRMIINIQPENVAAWLSPRGRSDAELHAILADRQKPYYEHQVMAA
ncbi:MAG: SOS response-associated peptidase family protein [Steroidobacteraceae bacterium]